MKQQQHKSAPFIVALLLLVLFSCRTNEEEVRQVFPEGTPESVNLWVYDQMKRYYYWENAMPAKPDYTLPTQQFFKSILVPEDRFSSIVNTQDPGTYPRTVRALFGFDYAVLKLSNNSMVTVIKLVLQNSPAANVGLKRGMVITKINGTALNADNAETLTRAISTFSSMTLTVGEWQDNSVINEKEITIYYGFTFEQPLLSKIFEKSGKKVGYLYIPDFREGIAQSFSQKFAEFKAAGVRELILDLRYNYGGSVASAAALCAMIPQGITADKPFIKYIGNKNGGTVLKTFGEQIAYDPSAPAFSALQTNNLNLARLYVLTSNHTASASEIVINNLKPYTDVVQVGTKTLGKDMAGFPIKDETNAKKISWEMHPMIYKVYNADGKGDYPNGLEPHLEADEYHTLPLLALGDENEMLLSVALGRASSKKTKHKVTAVFVREVLAESEDPGSVINIGK